MPKSDADDITGMAHELRKAWARGDETVEIGGVIYEIRRSDHRVVIQKKNDLPVTRIESWLVAHPVGKLVPLYNVELDPGKNFRA